jgi:NitT/TauT family transport system ATP-binding protein
VIRFDGVGLDLGDRTILSDINLTIEPGQFVCLIGPSGSGKTSLLRLLAGLTAPTRGEVWIGDRKVTGPDRPTDLVFQDSGRALLPWRTAMGNVALALEAIGTPARERDAVIHRLLDTLGLGQHASKFPAELSGGMQQRLQIARCLAQQPQVFLWDEPFGALDAMTRQTLQDEILRLAAQNTTTNFFVTHDLDEALYLAGRVVALSANPGRISQVIDVPLARPRNQLTTREERRFFDLRRDLFNIFEGMHS